MFLYGISASPGYAIGKVHVIKDNYVETAVGTTEYDEVNIDNEKSRLSLSIEKSREQLKDIYSNTVKSIGEGNAKIFESHLLFLDDPEFINTAIKNIVTNHNNAERAILDATKYYLSLFETIEDEYLRERSSDLKDISKRILTNLSCDHKNDLTNLSSNTIIVAHELTPSDTAQLDKTKIIGFITAVGGKNSHSAIIARAIELPAVVGVSDILSRVNNGTTIIIDGHEGIIITSPTVEELNEYSAKLRDYSQSRTLHNNSLLNLTTTPAITQNGKRILVTGNISSPWDLDKVISNGGDGVGLFRSEFLFMDSAELPNEEEQFYFYKTAAEGLAGKPVIIRTLDVGGDKPLAYLNLPKEENSFLGYRAIRICLDQVNIFKTQLRAILRASIFGRLQILLPMISSVYEFLKSKELLIECMEELDSQGIPFDKEIKLGIMVEIPSAAILADDFAKYVDFFSIGTNDLTQYTLAVDRTNENVSSLYNPMHPAVLALIQRTIEAAHLAGKPCGMCGELASEEEAIPLLVKYGLDEFSVNPSYILKTKQIVISS